MRDFRKISNPENLKDNLEEAIYFVKLRLGFNDVGVDLTNIEKYELRRLTELTTKQYIEDKRFYLSNKQKPYDKYQITPGLEAGLIFMNRNYGLSIRNDGDNNKFLLHRFYYEEELGYDPFPDFFAKLQEEMHRP